MSCCGGKHEHSSKKHQHIHEDNHDCCQNEHKTVQSHTHGQEHDVKTADKVEKTK